MEEATLRISDRQILGRSIALDFSRTPQVERFTVIGVMPPKFWMYYGNFEVFVPLARNVIRDDRKSRMLMALGRLKDGSTADQARDSLNAIQTDNDWSVLVRSWEEQVRRPVRAQWMVLAAGALLLLIVTSANVAGLRCWFALHARRREMAIRAALGASPARLFRLFIFEALFPGAAAALFGVAIAYACVKLMTRLLPPDIEMTRMCCRSVDRVTIDTSALAFAAIVGTIACLAAAAYPAWNIRKVDPIEGLKGDGVPSRTGRAVLVSAEVALAVVLLSGAGLLIKTLDRIRSIDLGFRPERLLVLRVPPAASQASPSYYTELSARVATLPGVESAALMSSLTGRSRNGFQIPGRRRNILSQRPDCRPRVFRHAPYSAPPRPVLRRSRPPSSGHQRIHGTAPLAEPGSGGSIHTIRWRAARNHRHRRRHASATLSVIPMPLGVPDRRRDGSRAAQMVVRTRA